MTDLAHRHPTAAARRTAPDRARSERAPAGLVRPDGQTAARRRARHRAWPSESWSRGFIFGLWWLLTGTGIVASTKFPSPVQHVEHLRQPAGSTRTWWATSASPWPGPPSGWPSVRASGWPWASPSACGALGEELIDSSMQMFRTVPFPGGDLPVHRVVRHRRDGQGPPDRPGHALPHVPEHRPTASATWTGRWSRRPARSASWPAARPPGGHPAGHALHSHGTAVRHRHLHHRPGLRRDHQCQQGHRRIWSARPPASTTSPNWWSASSSTRSSGSCADLLVRLARAVADAVAPPACGPMTVGRRPPAPSSSGASPSRSTTAPCSPIST